MDENNFQSNNGVNDKNNPEVETAHIDFSGNGGKSQIISSDKNKKTGRRLMWSFLVFIGIFILAGGGLWAWNKYLSPDAKYTIKKQAQYQKYLDFKSNYEKAMEADTYGGKTPQETLNMFIDALKKGDLDLASKYFILREDGSRNPNILKNLKSKTETETGDIVKILSNAKLTKSPIENRAGFRIIIKNGQYIIGMQKNKYSKVWKIENL